MQISQKQNTLSEFFFFQLGNLDSILKIFKKEMTLIADLFLNLRTPKIVVRYMSKNSRFFFFFFFFRFRNLDSILNIFKKKMTVIADVFLNLGTPKYVVRSMSEKSSFRRPFNK